MPALQHLGYYNQPLSFTGRYHSYYPTPVTIQRCLGDGIGLFIFSQHHLYNIKENESVAVLIISLTIKLIPVQTSQQWIGHFTQNLKKERVNWRIQPQLTKEERAAIVHSIQAWQLGETSDGAHLLAAAGRYAQSIGDPAYCEAVQLFIKEEQKHGNNLGRYLDDIGEKRIGRNWGDSLFRQIRYFNTSMELWTITVITVESAAQVFYQSLKDATQCSLLQQICTDILIDEAFHINFQQQRLSIIFSGKTILQKIASYQFYRWLYFSTTLVVWMAHRNVFKAGGNTFGSYWRKMSLKFHKTVHRLRANNRKPILDIPLMAAESHN